MRRFQLCFWVLCTLFFSAPSSFATPLSDDPNWVHGTLSNGMRYHLYRKNREEVSIRLLMNVGSINEKDDQWGYAHFIEHMAFNGSKHFKPNEIISLFERNGMEFGNDMNAFTSKERTVYRLDLPNDKDIEPALMWMSDIAHGLTLSSEEIEKEKGVILSEMRTHEEYARSVYTAFFKELATGTRYEHDVLGTEQSVSNASAQSLAKFYQTWYQPQSAELIITGNIALKNLQETIETNFSSWHSTNSNLPKQPKITLQMPTAVMQNLNQDDVGLSVLYPYPNNSITDLETQQKYWQLQLLRYLINDRFQSTYSAKPEIQDAINVSVIEHNHISMLALEVLNQPNKNRDFTQQNKTFLQHIASLQIYGVTQQELDEEIACLQQEIDQDEQSFIREDAATIAGDALDTLYNNDAFTEPHQWYQLQRDYIHSLTLEVVNKALKQLLAPKPAIIITTKHQQDVAAQQHELDGYYTALKYQGEKYQDQALLTKLQAPKHSGAITHTEIINPDFKYPITHYTLSNGLNVYYLRSNKLKQQTLQITYFGQGGLASLPEKQHFTQFWPNLFAQQNWQDSSNNALCKYLDKHNIFYQYNLFSANQNLYIDGNVKDADSLFSLASEFLTRLNITQSQVDSVQQKFVNQYQVQMSNPILRHISHMKRRIFSPDSGFIDDPMPSTSALSLQQAQQTYQSLYVPKQGDSIIIVSNVYYKNIEPYLTRYLAGLAVTPSHKMVTSPATLDTLPLTWSEAAGTNKSNRFDYVVITANTAKNYKTYFSDQLIDLIIDQRLNQYVREEKGLDYSPYLNQYAWQGAPIDIWRYSAYEDPKRHGELLTAYRHVLESMKTISNDELMVARKQFWNSLNHDLDFDDAWSNELLRALENHYSLTELPLYEQIIDGISVRDLEQRSNQLFGSKSRHFYSYLMPEPVQ